MDLQARVDPIPEPLYDQLHSASLFGRLLRLSSCRNTTTDEYDSGPAFAYHTPEVANALRYQHSGHFNNWLTLSLERQKADIRIYINSISVENRPSAVRRLRGMAESAIPFNVEPAARKLFLQDIGIVQMLLTHE